MNLKSTFKVSVVLKLICLFVVQVLMMDTTFAMYPDLSFAEVAQSADLIFIGTVGKKESYFNEQQTLIITKVLFEDIYIVHSKELSVQRDSSIIILKHAGGCIGDLCLDVSIAPSFQEGQRYLLFTTDDGKTYINPIIGGPQGFFRVVKDTQTGEEFVLTAGKKAVMGAEIKGLIKSKLPVSHIKNGFPVFEMNRDNSAESFFAQPPIPANPSDKASISFVQQEKMDSQALKLLDLINYIKDVALRVQIEKKILKKEGLGFFFKKNGTTIEKIPLEQWIVPVKEIKPELQDSESFQNQYTEPLSTNGAMPDRPLGGQLGYCGYHSLYLVMEMVPEDWWSYDTIESSMWIWNQFMDIYRITQSDGSFGHNDENEFGGWPDDSTLYRIYGVHWNGYYVWIHSWWRGNPCGRLKESDILFNPAYNWTDDENSALGNSNLILLRRMVMFGLANSWGMQRGEQGKWGYPPTFDYDSLTVVHSYYHQIVENGRGIHQPDAYLIRRAYSNQTGIKNIVDVGVESYYADNGLHNSTTNSSTYNQGDSISLYNVTVENISYNGVSDVRIRFYLSKNRNITAEDRQIGSYWYWDSFPGESSGVYDIDTKIPDDISPGTYYIGVIVTVNGYNQDDFTSNNTSSFYNTITIKSKSSGGDGGDGGDKGAPKCFIATAAFNSGFHPYVTILRDFRDAFLMHSELGRCLVELYYRYSPFIANLISKDESLKILTRYSLLPLVAFCYSILQMGH